MLIKTHRDEPPKDCKYLKIIVGDTEFRITEDKFGGITINKRGDESDTIKITPIVSNQINIE